MHEQGQSFQVFRQEYADHSSACSALAFLQCAHDDYVDSGDTTEKGADC